MFRWKAIIKLTGERLENVCGRVKVIAYVFAVFVLIYALVYAIGRLSERSSAIGSDETELYDNSREISDCDSEDDIEKVAAVAAAYYMMKTKSVAAVKPLADDATCGFSSWRQASIMENFEIVDICSKDRA
ncbi:MAG TPA: hypothetical protein PKH33_07745 [bacterium]|nr:hypothetical protein [bacterium]